MPDSIERAEEAARRLQLAGEAFAALTEKLGPVATELAIAEAEAFAAFNRAGIPPLRPSPRELAANVLLGNLAALRPSVAFVSEASFQEARAGLLRLAGHVGPK